MINESVASPIRLGGKQKLSQMMNPNYVRLQLPSQHQPRQDNPGIADDVIET
jgi:hypothetical protein